MSVLRGYIFSRPFMGERAPQHVQNIVLRDYCNRNGHQLLLAATEYAMENSTLILETVLQELEQIDGIVMYSLFQLPQDATERRHTMDRVISAGRSIHFAVEGICVQDASGINSVEEYWRVKIALGAKNEDQDMRQRGSLQNFVTPLHKSTQRDYLARMLDEKTHCMEVAKRFGAEYWDGDRRYGYGGYTYRPGYWRPVAEALMSRYRLGPGSKVLDVGCGKAFLLHELLLLEPSLEVTGIDISTHGIDGATDLVRPHLRRLDARQPLPFRDQEFDLAVSLAVLHNFRLPDLANSLREISRVSRQGFVMVESYRNVRELFNLQCWALTCETFMDVDAWLWLFESVGYRGDYEFIYFE
jgi:sporadic carbohydrate cluster protein (TIGR04323 family)